MLVPATSEAIKRAVAILEQGGVVAYPTDTLYGLGAAIHKPQGVERIFSIKGRPKDQGLPVLLASTDDLETVAFELPPLVWALAERFWPGPLTIVLKKAAAVPDVVTGGKETVAVRVPSHPVPQALIRGLGVPITGTSANLSGFPGPRTAQEVQEQLGGLVDMILDGGPCPGGVGSTIVDITVEPPVVLREGALVAEEVLAVARSAGARVRI